MADENRKKFDIDKFDILHNGMGDLIVTSHNPEIRKKRDIPERPSWDEYFLKVAYLVAERSTCLRHHVGAVIVKDNRILTTGYNGAAAHVKDCRELGCLRDELDIPSGQRHEICRAIHAEQNAIIQAGKMGVNINNSTMYCTHSPCIICAKMIVNAGIKRFVTSGDYTDKTFLHLFEAAGIEFVKIKRPNLKIIPMD